MNQFLYTKLKKCLRVKNYQKSGPFQNTSEKFKVSGHETAHRMSSNVYELVFV